MHEIYHNALRNFTGDPKGFYNCPSNYAIASVVEHLNERYAEAPSWTTYHDWHLERTTLLTCFVGYLWYYSEDDIQYLGQEIKFKLPLLVPKVGAYMPESEVVRVGKIDHVILWDGMVGVLERKSTTRDIDPSSDYWEKSRKDSQVSMYALTLKNLQQTGQLPLDGITYSRLGNTLYDVWRRPLTKPKMLTQGDTAEFLASQEYMGKTFKVNVVEGEPPVVTVDDETVEVNPGKKGFAIRESIEMYAARLLKDIMDRPAHYFQRKEIARTASELDKFEKEVYNLYIASKLFEKSGCWFENESQCRATFPCQYIPICYGPGADAVCDGETTPAGFKRIFVDLTVNNATLEE